MAENLIILWLILLILVVIKMTTACTMEDMYKNFQILADAKEKAGEVTVYVCYYHHLFVSVNSSHCYI